MAKLSAHGFEVCRVEVVWTADPSCCPSCGEADPYRCECPKWRNHVVKERTVYSFRSDGHILRKYVTTWQDGHRHDYGWKLYRRFTNRKLTPEQIKNAASRRADRMQSHNVEVIRKGC